MRTEVFPQGIICAGKAFSAAHGDYDVLWSVPNGRSRLRINPRGPFPRLGRLTYYVYIYCLVISS